MIEFLRHALGICGEPHPSLLTLLMGTPVLGYLIYRIKNCLAGLQKGSVKSLIRPISQLKLNPMFE